MQRLVLSRPILHIVNPHEHLSAADLAAFIDRTLPAERRSVAETHLSDCARCRGELAAAARLVASVPAQQTVRMPWRIGAGVAAAALVAAAVYGPAAWRSRATDARSNALERATSRVSRLVTVSPASDATIARTSLRFVWHRDALSTINHVVVTDASGAPVWSAEVLDTTVVPPASAPLSAGARYFWRVDAFHADGSVAQSGELPFRVVP